MTTRRIERGYWALGFVPLASLVIALLDAVYLRFLLGRLPVYPEDIDSGVNRALLYTFVLLTWVGLAGVPIMLLVPLCNLRNGQWKRLLLPPAVFAFGVCLFYLAVRSDPTTFFDWFFD